MDKYKNIYQVASPKDASYIRIELDISAVDGAPGGAANLNVYRAGYKDTDDPSKPYCTFTIPAELIHDANKHSEHLIQFHSIFGQIALSVDGKSALTVSARQSASQPPSSGFGRRPAPQNVVNLNPVGSGGNYLPFGMLCDIGFSVDAGQTAMFRDIIVRNHRAPNHILFRENLTKSGYRGIYADAAQSELRLFDRAWALRSPRRRQRSLPARDPSRNSMPMLRTTFKTAAKTVDSARLYITARGVYEVYLNGRRIGNDHYNPGLTQYNVTHMYQTYDVTSMIRPGENGMGAMLGEGWWSGLLSFGTIWNHFGDRQSLLAKLVVNYKDGTSDTIITNERTWKYYSAGPIVYSSLDLGEVYDASRENAVDGWSMADYDEQQWKTAVVVPLEGTAFLGADIGFAARVYKVLCKRSPHQIKENEWKSRKNFWTS